MTHYRGELGSKELSLLPNSDLIRQVIDPKTGKDCSGEERLLVGNNCIGIPAGVGLRYWQEIKEAYGYYCPSGGEWTKTDLLSYVSGVDINLPAGNYKHIQINKSFYPCEEGAGSLLYDVSELGKHLNFEGERLEDENSPVSWSDYNGWSYLDQNLEVDRFYRTLQQNQNLTKLKLSDDVLSLQEMHLTFEFRLFEHLASWRELFGCSSSINTDLFRFVNSGGSDYRIHSTAGGGVVSSISDFQLGVWQKLEIIKELPSTLRILFNNVEVYKTDFSNNKLLIQKNLGIFGQWVANTDTFVSPAYGGDIRRLTLESGSGKICDYRFNEGQGNTVINHYNHKFYGTSIGNPHAVEYDRPIGESIKMLNVDDVGGARMLYYTDRPAEDRTKTIEVDLWFKPTDAGSGISNQSRILECQYFSLLWDYVNSDKIRLRVVNDETGSTENYALLYDTKLGEWYRLKVFFNHNTATFSINDQAITIDFGFTAKYTESTTFKLCRNALAHTTSGEWNIIKVNYIGLDLFTTNNISDLLATGKYISVGIGIYNIELGQLNAIVPALQNSDKDAIGEQLAHRSKASFPSVVNNYNPLNLGHLQIEENAEEDKKTTVTGYTITTNIDHHPIHGYKRDDLAFGITASDEICKSDYSFESEGLHPAVNLEDVKKYGQVIRTLRKLSGQE